MDFAGASILPLKRYAEFGGRSTRTELIGFTFLSSLFTAAVLLVAGWLGRDDARPWLEGALAIMLLTPTLALHVRRLHDWGRSGWWLLVGAPFLAAAIWEYIAYPRPFSLHIQSHLPWWAAVPVILCVLALWALLLWDDDVGANRYGPNPRGWTPPAGEPA